MEGGGNGKGVDSGWWLVDGKGTAVASHGNATHYCGAGASVPRGGHQVTTVLPTNRLPSVSDAFGETIVALRAIAGHGGTGATFEELPFRTLRLSWECPGRTAMRRFRSPPSFRSLSPQP